MKKLNIIFPLLLLCSFQGIAQISLGVEQVPEIGDTIIYQNSVEVTDLSIGSTGANQVWDFTSLVPSPIVNTEFFVDPSFDTTGLFPTANLAIQDEAGVTNQFAQVTSDEVIALGLTSSNFMGFEVQVALDPQQTLFKIPTEYEDNYNDDYGFVFGLSEPQPGVDTARVITTNVDNVTADAYGVLRLPEGDFDVLRVETETQTILSVEIFLGFFWAPFISDTTMSTSYSFWAQEAKRELATVTMDSLGTGIARVSWQEVDALPATAPMAAFDYEANNITIGQIDFTDLSMNGPVEWLWDFGDGNTNIEQNPMHIYTISDDYEVCLTATNSGGSNQTCQTISVDVTPPAPTAAFNYQDTASFPGLVHFEDISANSPTEWAWDFGDSGTSSAQNPQHLFSMDNTYEVCLTVTNAGGSDMTCQTLFVNVRANDLEWNPEWLIAPNPTQGVFSLSLKDITSNDLSLTIHSSTGQLEQSQSINSTQTVDISSFANGTYLLNIFDGDKIIGSTLIQVLH